MRTDIALPIRLTFDWSDGAYLLRPYDASDDELEKQGKVYITWIMFTEADGYIVARLRNPFGPSMLMGMYKDQTFEWSDEILHNVEVHVDVACQICVWCEKSKHQLTGLWQDSSINHQANDRVHVVTPGELHNRLVESIYLGAHSALTIGEDEKRTKEAIACDITRNVLGSLSGRSPTLPTFKLVVDQSPVNVRIRELAWGDRFTNGDEVKPNSTTMVRRAHQFSVELSTNIVDTDDNSIPED